MKVKWLGHAAFLITSDSGLRVITDPYKPDGTLKYGEINESANIVTVSHQHADHNNIAAVTGNPQTVKASGNTKVKGIEFKGIATYHDDIGGKRLGGNTVFCFTVDNIRVCHLGDLGHRLSEPQMTELGKVDVLLIPVCGTYTIDAATATELGSRLKPRVMIPMHFRNDHCAYPVDGVDKFLGSKNNVTRLDTSEIEFKKESLPTNQIIVLKPSL